MLDYLRRLATRVLARFGPLDPPEEPYAGVRQPRPHRPGGRNAAIALEEPQERSDVRAMGDRNAR